MAGNDGNPEMLSEEELMKLLLKEDEKIHDEGRDLYFHEVMSKVRGDLGTDDVDSLPGTERIIFGRKKAESIGAYIKPFGRKALVVTGRSSVKTGLRDRILAQLQMNGIDSVVFDSVPSNPTTESIDAGAAFARENGCDSVLVVGGGSQMDAAKAIALVAGNGGSVRDYTGGRGNAPEITALPVVAVPTTCGTGSEANGISVLTDSDTHDKAGLTCKAAVPRVAVVDPELMETMPPNIMNAVSFDALCHLVESYVSGGRTDDTDLICRKGLRYLSESLVAANENIRDAGALDRVVYASSIAGVSIYKAGTVAPHALEHPLSGMKDIVHGRGLAAISPEIYRFCAKGSPERFAEVSRLFGGVNEDDVHEAIGRVLKDIGLEVRLSDEGFGHDDVKWLTESALRTAGTKLVRNPVPMTAEDIRGIYEACM
ncbi:MAG: iron-containing alcohol dehydrogenase [Thermoplasmata archaeon]|nr:iron-containing alcohol dehydrogenase [Thermoplasmata archaeon]